ncbi:hypothetical protein [Treponema phagedenis]|nr:hypothetical protein [Treponema phagedenis]
MPYKIPSFNSRLTTDPSRGSAASVTCPIVMGLESCAVNDS